MFEDLVGLVLHVYERGEPEPVDVAERPVEDDQLADGDQRSAESLVRQR